MVQEIADWRVSNKSFLSDHRQIIFRLTKAKSEEVRVRDLKKLIGLRTRRTQRSLKAFKSFKSVELDQIFPVLLQERLEQIIRSLNGH